MIGPARPLPRRFRPALGAAVLLLSGAGCEGRAVLPAGAGVSPPAYTRDKILDPRLAEVARSFTAWAAAHKVGDRPTFDRVEVLPPAPTLLPYGVGTYQKQLRLPAILITGPGWRDLPPDEREGLAAQAFRTLADLLETAARGSGGGGASALPATLTIQTSQGLELGWINDLEPGRALLHGQDW
jgi:hypothetical protein